MISNKTLMLMQSIPVYPKWIHINIKDALSITSDVPLCESDSGGIAFISEEAKQAYLEREISKMEKRRR